MKCPKCGYLGFEQADRCRNCGYEFALTAKRSSPELSLREDQGSGFVDDLELIDAAAAKSRATIVPPEADGTTVFTAQTLDEGSELPLFTDDAPLITTVSPPRPPLAVRRATPEVPRPRQDPSRPTPLSFQERELEVPLDTLVSPAARAHHPEWAPSGPSPQVPAGIGARLAAAAIDLVLLGLVDLIVVYLTIQICGLSSTELHLLPLGPLIAFLIVQNGGYLVAFTAGGQTIGKMLTGIRVVAAEPGQVLDLGRSLQRELLWVLMALPAGLGLLSAMLSPDRRGFHDRFSGTKVIRAAA